MSTSEFEIHLEKSVSGLARSVIELVCSEIEMETGGEDMGDHLKETTDTGDISAETTSGEKRVDTGDVSGETTPEEVISNLQEETASEEEQIAFFQAARQAEYNKIVVAAEKEEREQRKRRKTAVSEQQCDDFFLFSIDNNFMAIYPEKSSQHNYYYQEPTTSYMYNKTYGYFTAEDADLYTDTPGNRMTFDRSFSDAGVKRKISNNLISKLFKRSKSLSFIQKNCLRQKCDMKEGAVGNQEKISEDDVDNFVEPPRPRLKPFFCKEEEEVEEQTKAEVAHTEEQTTRGNLLSRVGRSIRGFFRGLSCCCCKTDIVSSPR